MVPTARWFVAILVVPALLLPLSADDAARVQAAIGVTTLVSVDSAGNQGDGISYNGEIAGDGSVVAFESAATNLVPGGAGAWRASVPVAAVGPRG